MRSYDLTCLISPELKKEELRKLISKIETLLQKRGGILFEQKEEKKVKLGYEIKKQKEAFLSVFKFQMAPENVASFKKALQEIPEILRFMILALKKPVQIKMEKPKEIKKISKEKKVELKEIEKKLEEILKE